MAYIPISSNRESYMHFRWTYLHLILAKSKDKGGVPFSSEYAYLVIGDK